jgi:hypothetical protein
MDVKSKDVLRSATSAVVGRKKLQDKGKHQVSVRGVLEGYVRTSKWGGEMRFQVAAKPYKRNGLEPWTRELMHPRCTL